MYILGAFVVSCAVGVVVLIVFQPLPSENRDIINIAIGALLTMAGTVVSYFFGSSKGSTDKTSLLAKANSAESQTT